MENVTSLAQYTPPAALAKPLEFTPEQSKMIRDTYASGASEAEFKMLMAIASARHLNPLLRQIWFVQRWDNQKRCMVWAPQVSIDGLRSIAQRTGLYDGQDEPEFVEQAGKLAFCRVRVYRKDWSRPAVGIAHFSEYAAKKKDGGLTQMWAEKPHIMMAKCAEALGLRKAFPEDTAGLYVPEEMSEDAAPTAQAVAQDRAKRIVAKSAAGESKPAPAANDTPAPKHDAKTGEVVEGEVVQPPPAGEPSLEEQLLIAIGEYPDGTDPDAIKAAMVPRIEAARAKLDKDAFARVRHAYAQRKDALAAQKAGGAR